MRTSFALVVTIASTACAGLTSAPAVNPHAALLLDFETRIERYLELREKALERVGSPDVTTGPAELKTFQEALFTQIRALRPNANHGDILTPAIRSHFRSLVRPELKGEDGRDIRAKLQDDAPAPGAVPLEVNARYPAGEPLPTTPVPVLLALPTLPRGLEYRIIGTDLILLDQPANLIVDFMRNLIPATPA